jgi:hypothetical protein
LVVELAREEAPDRFETLGAWVERLDFTVANPLELSLAPVERGLQLKIANPSRSPFTGKARVGDHEQAVQLTAQQPEATLTTERPTAGVAVELRDKQDTVVARLPLKRLVPLPVDAMRAALDGDAKVPAQASLVLTNAPAEAGRPFTQAWRLDYRFDAGWRFVRAVVAAPKTSGWRGRPQALGLWVHGDGSQNALRARVTDDQQQTFQPTGPDLTWTGWRWVTFDLANLKHAGHWGGPDDGEVHGGLRLDTLLLVDSARKQTSGTVWFAGPVLIYENQPE